MPDEVINSELLDHLFTDEERVQRALDVFRSSVLRPSWNSPWTRPSPVIEATGWPTAEEAEADGWLEMDGPWNRPRPAIGVDDRDIDGPEYDAADDWGLDAEDVYEPRPAPRRRRRRPQPLPPEEGPSTYGVELEFESGAQEVLAGLHGREIAPFAELHRYHCDCEDCEEGLVRGQRDSTCSGELITAPLEDLNFGMDNVFVPIMEEAIACDAEPGLHAGMHVHVDMRRVGEVQKVKTFVQWLRWEETMELLAQGRFPLLRQMNRPVNSEDLRYRVSRHGYRTNRRVGSAFTNAEYEQMLSELDGESWYNTWAGWMYDFHMNADRHSHLSTYTRHGTWEFRIWNSTRSAWRMRLAAGASLAWSDPGFIDILSSSVPSASNLVLALGAFDSVTGELAERQFAYINHRAADCPAAFNL